MYIKRSVTYYLKGPEAAGEKRIYLSMTYGRHRLLMPTGHSTAESKWDNANQRCRRNTMNAALWTAARVNEDIEALGKRCSDTLDILTAEGGDITPKSLRSALRAAPVEQRPTYRLRALWGLYCAQSRCTPRRVHHLKVVGTMAEASLGNLTADRLNTLTTDHLLKFMDDVSEGRGRNRTVGIMKILRAFYKWCIREGHLTRTPFVAFTMPAETYGRPICLTKAERDQVAAYEPETDQLRRCRDMFILQCFIGCRVSDLLRLSTENLVGDAIEYIPNKGSTRAVRVPLSEAAREIISRSVTINGQLMNWHCEQKYNLYLKELLQAAKVSRMVTRINPRSGKEEQVPLWSIATSHLARRTFISILHRKVKNEVIASMTGHAEGSRAFSRYYDIDEDVKVEAVRGVLE